MPRAARSAERFADRSPLRILITAGPTREYIDPVRFLSNDSSGKMGFAIARCAAQRGHAVTLIAGPVVQPTPEGVQRVDVVSAADMLRAARRAWKSANVLVMAAAVADYTPADPARFKLKKSARTRVLRLTPTADVLADLSARRRVGQCVIGFALEDRAGRANAAEKLRRKGLDAIVLNRPTAIGADASRVEVLVRGAAWRRLPAGGKTELAERLLPIIEEVARAAGRGCP